MADRPAEQPRHDVGPGIDATRLAAARLFAARQQPFLAQALFALSPVTMPKLGTFAVDEHWRLYIDPQILQEWSVPEVAGVLLHEVGHVVREHAARARTAGVDHKTHLLWNVAADAELNDDLLDDGVTLPPGVTPGSLNAPNGMLAEWYYARLLDGRLVPPSPCPNCGSGSHGVPEGWELDERVGVPRGLSPAEALVLRIQTAQAVLVHRRAQGRGVRDGWSRWAEAHLRPKLDWRRLLGASVRAGVAEISGAVDYSYARPSRRQVPGIVMPTLRRPLPRVAVILDTSASVDDEMLGAAWAEVTECLRRLGLRRDLITVWATDVSAVKVGHLGASLAVAGGGGTDLRTGFEACLQHRPRPQLIVVLTDGFTPWPQQPPPARVVVGLLTSPYAAVPPVPTWSTSTVIDVDRPAVN